MPLAEKQSEVPITFQIGDGTGADFQVLRYRGSEGLCQLYRFEIELASDVQTVTFDEIIGAPAKLIITTATGFRVFRGIISRFEMTGQTVGLTYYRAELAPDIWLLTHRYYSRIFQNKSVADIINQVLTSAGIASDHFRMQVSDQTPREYCTQYRETDYNFISRLMEEEGIRWYFEQREDDYVFVMEDTPPAYPPIDGEPAAIPFVGPSGMVDAPEHVFRFRMSQAVRPGAVVLNDFDFKKPKLKLRSDADNGRDASLKFYDYPGEYETQADGTRLAKLRAEEFEAKRIVGVGQSNCSRLAPGRAFEMTEHPVESMNGQYLITSVTHQGKQPSGRTSATGIGRTTVLDPGVLQSIRAAQNDGNRTIQDLAGGLLQIAMRLQAGDESAHRELAEWMYHGGQLARDIFGAAVAAGASPMGAITVPNLLEDTPAGNRVDFDAPVYESRFECIPSATTYRPPRVTPWPVMRGTQTALIVGPEGEEIHCDKYGRVKVHFHWDLENKHDDSASCWIRVSQAMAGGGYGSMFLPRIGQEVIVDFLEGNPDQPIIIGRVYNVDHMPPYGLPDAKTKSVIKGRSSKGGGGSNEIRFEDGKDNEQMLLYGQRDLHIRFKRDAVETIERDKHLIVGNNRQEEVQKDYHLKLVEGDKLEELGKDYSLKIVGNVSIEVGGTHATKITGDVVERFDANHKHEVATTYACKATSIKLEASTGIELKCGGNSITLTTSGIHINGTKVNINSGAGPSVSAVSAQLTSPTAPEKPLEADTVEHGKDTRYDGGEPPPEPEPPPPDEPVIVSWIELEMVDEADMPVAGEVYEVLCPDGKTVKRGSLDANGFAHVPVKGQGTCQISFPNLDMVAWVRI